MVYIVWPKKTPSESSRSGSCCRNKMPGRVPHPLSWLLPKELCHTWDVHGPKWCLVQMWSKKCQKSPTQPMSWYGSKTKWDMLRCYIVTISNMMMLSPYFWFPLENNYWQQDNQVFAFACGSRNMWYITSWGKTLPTTRVDFQPRFATNVIPMSMYTQHYRNTTTLSFCWHIGIQ